MASKNQLLQECHQTIEEVKETQVRKNEEHREQINELQQQHLEQLSATQQQVEKLESRNEDLVE